MEFDKYAEKWDTPLRIKRAKTIADKIKSMITCDNLTAMEFGCGTGLVSFNLYDKFKKVTMIDASEGMIEILKSKIDEYKVTNMEPICIDLCNEKLDESYDVIYNSMVLHHIEDTNFIVKNFYDHLNNSGHLYIVDLNEEDGRFHMNYPDFHGHNGFDQNKLQKILEEAGFTDVKSTTFYEGEKEIQGEAIKYSLFIMEGKKL